jgi:hypothetical protein
MNLLRSIVVVLAMLCWATTAAGVTPADQQATHEVWERTVGRFAEDLAAGVDEPSLAATLSEGHAIRTFAGKPATLADISTAAASAAWFKPLAYDMTPDLLASDFGAMAMADQAIDPVLRRYLSPANDSAARTSNGTALKWITQVLAPRSDQPVGVIVLFQPSADEKVHGRVTIVLAAGERVGARAFRIKRIAFGQFEVPKPS